MSGAVSAARMSAACSDGSSVGIVFCSGMPWMLAKCCSRASRSRCSCPSPPCCCLRHQAEHAHGKYSINVAFCDAMASAACLSCLRQDAGHETKTRTAHSAQHCMSDAPGICCIYLINFVVPPACHKYILSRCCSQSHPPQCHIFPTTVQSACCGWRTICRRSMLLLRLRQWLPRPTIASGFCASQ